MQGFEPAATGPDAIAQCVGDCIAVVVGRGGGELGLPTERSRATAYRAIRAEISVRGQELPVLVIDEAQHLRNDVLEDIRLLCTAKYRTHSLFRQGLMLYDHIPNWSDERVGVAVLIDATILNDLAVVFDGQYFAQISEMLMEQRVFKEIFGVI